MPTYSADQIVGKTLIAKKNVSIYREPSKSAKVIYVAKPGITVGTVYSWVNGQGGLWWQYIDQNGVAYYTFHEPGMYDVAALNAQGTTSLETQQEQQAAADNPVNYYLNKFLKPALFIFGGYYVIRAVIDLDSYSKTRRSK